MKKILLSLFTFVATSVAAFAGDNLVENGGFEDWANGVAVAWKSTTTASSAKVSLATRSNFGRNVLTYSSNGSYISLVIGQSFFFFCR